MDSIHLLRLIEDGEFHSGLRLAQALGTSRSDVRRQVRAVEALGVRLFKVRGRGYRLARPLDLLDARRLEELLAGRASRFAIEILDQCGSTNAELLERARRGSAGAAGGALERNYEAAPLQVLACERQVSGRGRRGAQWLSGIGTSLTFSMLAHFREGAGALAGLSLAVAVAAARALEASGVARVQLKWPNDLLFEGRKLGGILIELISDFQGPTSAVIGIGLNVALPRELRRGIGQPVADLAEALAQAPPRAELLAAVLLQLDETLAEFSRRGFAAFRADWTDRHAYQGRRVVLKLADQAVAEGEAIGVAEDGALLLRSSRGVERFHSGELSLRPA